MNPQANSGMPDQENGQPEPLQQFGAQPVITPGSTESQPEYFPPAFVDPSAQVPTPAQQPVQPIEQTQAPYVGPAFMQEPLAVVATANPASPVPAFAAAAPAGEFTSNPFLAFGKGFGAGLFRSPGATIGIGLLIILASVGIAILGGVVTAILTAISPVLVILGAILTLATFAFICYLLLARAIVALIKSNQGESVTFRQTAEYAGTSVGIKLFVQQLLIGIVSMIGLLLFIIPGIFIWTRLSLAPFALINENAGVMGSVKRSWALTKGNFWNMLGGLTAESVASGTSLVFITGIYGARANRYQELTALEQTGSSNSGKTHWLNYFLPILVAIISAIYIAVLVASVFLSNNLPQNSATPNSTTTNSLSTGKYCYFNIDSTNLDASNYACTDDATECLANESCKEANADQL